ncbi:MAG: putative ADP-heptose synthase [Microgenomates group bacterium GW2011_GWC1_43_11]|nr:MAG: putative ADP-heptose synthase [Microgenomates group bacterium GW2011_GWC1_43_11]
MASTETNIPFKAQGLDFKEKYERIHSRSGEFVSPYLYKILTEDEAALVSKRLRNDNQAFVLVSGVFQLIHPGHLAFLAEAKKLGTILGVITPTDEQIKQYKDPNGPIITLTHRLNVLSSLEFVDFVFPQQSWFTMDVLQKVRPTIFAYVASPENDHMLSRIQSAKQMGIELRGITLDTSDFSDTRLFNLIEKLK